MAVGALITACFTGMRLALILNVLAVDASPLSAGVVTGLMMLIPAFVSVRIGRLADRHGHTRICFASAVLIAAGALIAGWQLSLVAMGAAAVAAGLAQTLSHVSTMNAVGQSAAPADSAKAFSWLALCHSMGVFVGPVLTGLLIDGLGARASFLAWSIPAVAVVMLVACGPKNRPVMARQGPVEAGRSLMSIPRLRMLMLMSAMVAMAWDAYTFVIPLRATSMQFSATQIGALAGSFAAGGFGIRLVLGPIAQRWGAEKVLRLSLVTSGVCYACYLFADSMLGMMALGAVLGIVLGAAQPMSWSLLHRDAPEGRSGEALGMRSVIVSVSQMTLPLAFGAAASLWGTELLFAAVSLTLFVGLIVLRRMH